MYSKQDMRSFLRHGTQLLPNSLLNTSVLDWLSLDRRCSPNPRSDRGFIATTCLCHSGTLNGFRPWFYKSTGFNSDNATFVSRVEKLIDCQSRCKHAVMPFLKASSNFLTSRVTNLFLCTDSNLLNIIDFILIASPFSEQTTIYYWWLPPSTRA